MVSAHSIIPPLLGFDKHLERVAARSLGCRSIFCDTRLHRDLAISYHVEDESAFCI